MWSIYALLGGGGVNIFPKKSSLVQIKQLIQEATNIHTQPNPIT
jgi:hypothetical protein